MKKTLSQVGEFGLIDLIRKTVGHPKNIIKSVGDDTAVVPFLKNKYLLLTTDMLVEGVHFTKKMDPLKIGRKAVACSISDIAAMGGCPKYILVSFGASGKTIMDFALKILKGMEKISREFSSVIVGGDTVRVDKVVINIAVIGEVKKNEVIYRSNAKKGDLIFVSGPLGASLSSGRHLTFMPRIKESQYLVKKFKPSSMTDISDGLIADLGHIMKESNAGAFVSEELIPLNKKANIKNALFDGEDFELLFTVPRLKAKGLFKNQNKDFKFYMIGEITDSKKGLVLVGKDGKENKLKINGYTHF